MTIDKFILGKPELDFFFKPKGDYKSLQCGTLNNGEFKSYREFKFDESKRIISEIGIQSGWSAYPPGMTPPPPIQYLRHYTYENEQLKSISEIDKNSKEKLKSYVFNYSNHLISEIIETKENSNKYSPRRSCYFYDDNGNLVKEINYNVSLPKTQSYQTCEIIRNETNQIERVIYYHTVKSIGQIVSLNEISRKEIKYEAGLVKKIAKNPSSDKTYTTIAELLNEQSNLIKEITYPIKINNRKEVFDYDKKDIISRLTKSSKEDEIIIYKYE
jgi:hypothetical protein